MQTLHLDELYVGMALPEVTYGPMDRFDYIPIALILRDTNPLHLDRVYAQERGLSDVVQQGPLNQAYLYRYFTALLQNPWDLVSTKIRFAANVFPGDTLLCGGEVLSVDDHPSGGNTVRCKVWQHNQTGAPILQGEAVGRVANTRL